MNYTWPTDDSKRKGLVEALSALYYLPQNYKLKIVTQVAAQAEARQEIASLIDDQPLIDRIYFATETGRQKGISPFSFVVQGDAEKPEALASAVLKSARAL